MRYIDLTFGGEVDPFTGATEPLFPAGGDRRGSVRNMTLLRDGTVVELWQLAGDRETVERALAARPDVLDFEVFTTHAGEQAVHVHVEPDERVAQLLELVQRHHLVVDMPIRVDDDSVRVRVVGDAERLHDAVADLSAERRATLTVERVGEYEPGTDDLRSVLTDRQRAVLDAAVAVGYYATPRRATVEDVAAAADCAPSTASEHLRKIEARVLSRLASV